MAETGIHDWMMRLYQAHGVLTPEVVREAARPADSPAHGFVFGLPPDQAAEQHYLAQAHKLIQQVRVTVLDGDGGPPRRVRFFIALPGDTSGYQYEPLTVVRESAAKMAAARTEALRRLKQAQDAVEDLDLLAAGSPASSRTAGATRAVKRARRLVEAG